MLYVFAFRAKVVGVKNELALFQALQQYYACMWYVAGARRGQCHGVHFVYFSFLCFYKPLGKESNGVVTNSYFIKCCKYILIPYVGNIFQLGCCRNGLFFVAAKVFGHHIYQFYRHQYDEDVAHSHAQTVLNCVVERVVKYYFHLLCRISPARYKLPGYFSTLCNSLFCEYFSE